MSQHDQSNYALLCYLVPRPQKILKVYRTHIHGDSDWVASMDEHEQERQFLPYIHTQTQAKTFILLRKRPTDIFIYIAFPGAIFIWDSIHIRENFLCFITL